MSCCPVTGPPHDCVCDRPDHGGVLYPHDTWRHRLCDVCGRRHPRNCDVCTNGTPACGNHVCSWPDDEEEES